MEALIEQLRQLTDARAPVVTLNSPELRLFAGIETRNPSQPYYWDGMKRGADPAHPFLLFQYTLDGQGCYAARGVSHRLLPGMAFTTIIPSDHVYYLPPASASWTFFWIITHHPYIVERIARRQQDNGAILTAVPNSPLVRRAVDLFARACRPSLGDPIDQERALFEFLWEHERMTRRDDAEGADTRMLDEVRQYVLGAVERPVAVTELAALHGMSRSHYSHRFKAATGLGVASFIRQIRLEEATRRLLHTDQAIARIAEATGFANANHFCKIFRQHFHLSPGAFRRQMRSFPGGGRTARGQ